MDELISKAPDYFVRKKKELEQMKKGQEIDATPDVMDATDILIKEAKDAGYDSILDYVKHTYKTWNKEVQVQVFEEIYDDFLDACFHGLSKKPYGKGNYSGSSSFREYLSFRKKECISRLEELDWLKVQQKPSFAGLTKFLPDMTGVPKGVGEPLSQENFEFFELLYRRSLELITEVLSSEDKYNSMFAEIENRAKQRAEADVQIDELVKDLEKKST